MQNIMNPKQKYVNKPDSVSGINQEHLPQNSHSFTGLINNYEKIIKVEFSSIGKNLFLYL